MNDLKKRIVLTDDNWHDYLPMDYVEKLVAESPPPARRVRLRRQARHPVARLGGDAERPVEGVPVRNDPVRCVGGPESRCRVEPEPTDLTSARPNGLRWPG